MGDDYATATTIVRYGNRPRARWSMHRRISIREARTALGNLLVAEERSEKSWYRTGNPDILVATEDSDQVRPLSDYSPVIKQLKEAPHRQVRLYSLPEKADEGRRVVQEKLRSTS